MTNCIFEPITDISSATICKHCGQEKMLHNHNIRVPQLYTEEQVMGFHKWAFYKVRLEESDKTTQELFDEWKSLKQPKKD